MVGTVYMRPPDTRQGFKPNEWWRFSFDPGSLLYNGYQKKMPPRDGNNRTRCWACLACKKHQVVECGNVADYKRRRRERLVRRFVYDHKGCVEVCEGMAGFEGLNIGQVVPLLYTPEGFVPAYGLLEELAVAGW